MAEPVTEENPLRELFDNPPVEEPAGQYSEMFGADEDQRSLALAFASQAPGETIRPEDALGDEALEGTLPGDPAVASEFAAAWDWGMTPSQRADMLARTAFDREMKGFIDGATELCVKPPVDPFEYARQTIAAREARHGR